jgi:hypothetical protein
MSLITRARIEVEDYLRWHPATRNILHHALRKAPILKSQDTSAVLRSVVQLCAAARRTVRWRRLYRTPHRRSQRRHSSLWVLP